MTIRINADLLIPGRGEPITDGAVVIDGSTIAYAGPASDAPDTPDAEVGDVPTVLPGLWECHGHFIGERSPDPEMWAKGSPVTRTARAVADVSRTLDGGITSVRELGGLGLMMQPAIADGSMRGPTIYGAGDVLSTTGGHGDTHAFPLDWVQSGSGFGVLCDGVPECLKAVRLQLRGGARVIKVCASGGVISEVDDPIHQQFSGEELHAIVAEAGRAERVVAAHCHGKAGIMAALDAGVKTIEHGSYLDEEAALLMIERDAILVPTRSIVAQLPEMEDILPRYAYEKGVAIADRHAEALKIAIAAGVTIAMGTDFFISGDAYGRNSLEIRHLQDAGMSALEAIEAATATGPLTLGPQAPASGQLVAGYDADVIAIDFNPLADNTGWGDRDRVTHVWKSGHPVKQPAMTSPAFVIRNT
ncbi:MAG: amidohydrolase family protein [Acidimicrobiia bacterium]|nr:MAG: amidohydrolase family protein [Acidimicrobiia bacterium]